MDCLEEMANKYYVAFEVGNFSVKCVVLDQDKNIAHSSKPKMSFGHRDFPYWE